MTPAPRLVSARAAVPLHELHQLQARQNPGGSPNSFYKNLFYILIGLLCAFGLVSFLSLMRARRRRRQILAEAERLGVLVPGVPGYIPMRERTRMRWTRSDGTEAPDWWEINHKDSVTAQPDPGPSFPAHTDEDFDHSAFQPLGLVPPPTEDVHEPPPISRLKFFPNHLAYRPDALFPSPSKYQATVPSTLDGLDGESVEVMTIIQMPSRPWPEGKEVDESEEVIKEWSGVELGIARLDVGRAHENDNTISTYNQ